MSDQRNLSSDDVAYETYEDFLNARVERILDVDRTYRVSAQILYRKGLFGVLLSSLEREPTRGTWEAAKHADCQRCGKPDVGIVGLLNAVRGPEGETHGVDQHAILCDTCLDAVLDDYREHGEIQPTVRGKWWRTGVSIDGGESA